MCVLYIFQVYFTHYQKKFQHRGDQAAKLFCTDGKSLTRKIPFTEIKLWFCNVIKKGKN